MSTRASTLGSWLGCVGAGLACLSGASPSARAAVSAGEAAALRTLVNKTCTNCHDAQDDLNLELPLRAWVGRAGASGRVMIVPGQPEASYLYRKVVGGADMQGALMPIGSDPWSPAQRRMLYDYIVQLGTTPKPAPPKPAQPKARAKAPPSSQTSPNKNPPKPSPGSMPDRAHQNQAQNQTPNLGTAEGEKRELGTSTPLGDTNPDAASPQPETPANTPSGASASTQRGQYESSSPGPKPQNPASDTAAGRFPPGDRNGINPVGTVSPDTGYRIEESYPAGEPRRRPAAPLGTHQVNLQTTTTLPKKRLEMRIHHRFSRIGKPGEGRYFGLGVSEGMTMSMGLGYGITDALDVLLRFSNERKDWELGAKYLILDRRRFPVALSAYASAEWLSESPKVAANRFTGNGQLLVSRDLGPRVWLSAGIGYSLRSNHHPNPQIWTVRNPGEPKHWYPIKDTRGTLTILSAASVFLNERRSWSLDLEYLVPIPDGKTPHVFFYRGGDADPTGTKIGSWSLGTSIKLGLHLFQVFVTNNQSIHTNLVASGGDTKNPFSPFGDMFLGFNLTRQWKL